MIIFCLLIDRVFTFILFCRNSQPVIEQLATISYLNRKNMAGDFHINTFQLLIRQCTSELVVTAIMRTYLFIPQPIKTGDATLRDIDGLDFAFVLLLIFNVSGQN